MSVKSVDAVQMLDDCSIFGIRITWTELIIAIIIIIIVVVIVMILLDMDGKSFQWQWK